MTNFDLEQDLQRRKGFWEKYFFKVTILFLVLTLFEIIVGYFLINDLASYKIMFSVLILIIANAAFSTIIMFVLHLSFKYSELYGNKLWISSFMRLFGTGLIFFLCMRSIPEFEISSYDMLIPHLGTLFFISLLVSYIFAKGSKISNSKNRLGLKKLLYSRNLYLSLLLCLIVFPLFMIFMVYTLYKFNKYSDLDDWINIYSLFKYVFMALISIIIIFPIIQSNRQKNPFIQFLFTLLVWFPIIILLILYIIDNYKYIDNELIFIIFMITTILTFFSLWGQILTIAFEPEDKIIIQLMKDLYE